MSDNWLFIAACFLLAVYVLGQLVGCTSVRIQGQECSIYVDLGVVTIEDCKRAAGSD